MSLDIPFYRTFPITRPVRVNGNMIFKGRKLTIGLDLGDCWSNYCVLDEAGEILLEQKRATTPEAMKQTNNLSGSPNLQL
jgi:hypothetical protein